MTEVPRTAGINKVPLHEESVRLLELIDRLKRPPYYELGVEKAREANLKASKTLAGPYEFTGTTEDLKVPSPDVPGTVLKQLLKYCIKCLKTRGY